MKEVTPALSMDRATTEQAIQLVKSTFLQELSKQLNLSTVSAPVVVQQGTGVNDDLNGVEHPIQFYSKGVAQTMEVVQSLAKWKRLKLGEYGIAEGKGIVADMRALRPDEELSPIHSIYVDQFDWEQRISPEERTINKLKVTVKKIYTAFKYAEQVVYEAYPDMLPFLPADITFIHSEDLLKEYPNLSPKERENQVTEQFGAVFIIGIGGTLADNTYHDGRAPDYDDWSTATSKTTKGLNGDILVWNPTLNSAFEVSSMGIRVNEAALMNQLALRGNLDRQNLYFHKQLLEGKLPQSIGGGIGQSRLAMLLLRKRHIGEVQASVWSEKTRQEAQKQGYTLL